MFVSVLCNPMFFLIATSVLLVIWTPESDEIALAQTHTGVVSQLIALSALNLRLLVRLLFDRELGRDRRELYDAAKRGPLTNCL
jgi:hypothetical protein